MTISEDVDVIRSDFIKLVNTAKILSKELSSK
jgi:hypothetical protein